jgi:outer membrane biosynthesis protein TonB
VNPARREPLLWLQLLGLAALPLEALLLLLVLAGADPGPFPGFERVLAWALGALAPAVLFWRFPPDLWSLLLLQVPLRGRRPEQLRLSALQGTLPLKLLSAAGALLLLPLLWWTDASAGLAWAWSPFSASPRLVVLLASVPLLALMLWQWQQLIQAVWMLSRPAGLVDQTLPLTQAIAAETRLNVGLPLLLLAPLAIDAPSEPPAAPPQREPAAVTDQDAVQESEPVVAAPEPELEAEPEPAASLQEPTEDASDAPSALEPNEFKKESNDEEPQVEADAEPSEAAQPAAAERSEPFDPAATEPSDDASAASDAAVVDGGVAITPEQATEQHQGTNLDS